MALPAARSVASFARIALTLSWMTDRKSALTH
jgi:hypothetical protein